MAITIGKRPLIKFSETFVKTADKVNRRNLLKLLKVILESCYLKLHMYITKTYLYNFDPLKPHFYILKLGFAGVQVIFLISAQNMDCGYSLEPPRRGGSNEYPQSMC